MRELTDGRDVFPSPYQDVNEFIGGYLRDIVKCALVQSS